MIDLTDVVPHAPVPQETIDRFRGQVPDELIDIWQRYGFGTFGQGFFKVVDPACTSPRSATRSAASRATASPSRSS